MNEQQLSEVLQAMIDRGSPEYNTPSGAFLKLLSQFAKDHDIAAFAEACHMFTRKYQPTRNFIAAHVPGIICNSYLATLPNFDFNKFRSWSLKTPEWADPLKKNFDSSTELNIAVAQIIQTVSDFQG